MALTIKMSLLRSATRLELSRFWQGYCLSTVSMHRLKLFCLTAMLAPLLLHAETSPQGSVRQSIAKAVTSSAADQDSILAQIVSAGGVSKAERDLLTSWTNGEIYLYDDPSGKSVPIVLEQPDTSDKTRAFRVDTGELLQDANGAAVMIDPTTATASDINAGLRKKIQRTLDLLSLSDPNPDVRRAIAFKLGSSQKAENLSILQTRLNTETDSGVKKVILQAKALIELADRTHPDRQVAAADALATLNCIGGLDGLGDATGSYLASPEGKQTATEAIPGLRRYL